MQQVVGQRAQVRRARDVVADVVVKAGEVMVVASSGLPVVFVRRGLRRARNAGWTAARLSRVGVLWSEP